MTREPSLRLAGRIEGATGLWLGAEEVPIVDASFETLLALETGENRVELVARDRVGNETRWGRTVLLDQKAPELLGQSVSPARAAGGENVEIVVRARDRSGLKRLARYVLRVGETTRSGTLILDPLTGAYRGILSLPPGLTGPAPAPFRGPRGLRRKSPDISFLSI